MNHLGMVEVEPIKTVILGMLYGFGFAALQKSIGVEDDLTINNGGFIINHMCVAQKKIRVLMTLEIQSAIIRGFKHLNLGTYLLQTFALGFSGA